MSTFTRQCSILKDPITNTQAGLLTSLIAAWLPWHTTQVPLKWDTIAWRPYLLAWVCRSYTTCSSIDSWGRRRCCWAGGRLEVSVPPVPVTGAGVATCCGTILAQPLHSISYLIFHCLSVSASPSLFLWQFTSKNSIFDDWRTKLNSLFSSKKLASGSSYLFNIIITASF